MQIFIDTADVEEIEKATNLGIIDGVTTNPSLIKSSGRNFFQTLHEIASIVKGPISAEVIATDHETMLKQGLKLSEIAKNITIKVPLTEDGLKTCYALRKREVTVNVTLCFSAAQALLAAKTGATFISPFIGRIDDLSTSGINLIKDIKTIYDNYKFKTKILAASIRHPLHIIEVAKLGVDIVTVPPKIIHQLIKHPMTDKGLQSFLSDWEKTGESIL